MHKEYNVESVEEIGMNVYKIIINNPGESKTELTRFAPSLDLSDVTAWATGKCARWNKEERGYKDMARSLYHRRIQAHLQSKGRPA